MEEIEKINVPAPGDGISRKPIPAFLRKGCLGNPVITRTTEVLLSSVGGTLERADFNIASDTARHLVTSVTPTALSGQGIAGSARPAQDPADAEVPPPEPDLREAAETLTPEQIANLKPNTRFKMWAPGATASFIQLRKLELLFFLLKQFGIKWVSALRAAGCGPKRISGEEFCLPGWDRSLDEIERFCALRGWKSEIKTGNLGELGERLADFVSEIIARPNAPFWATAEGFGVMPDFGAAAMHRLTADFFRKKMLRALPPGVDSEIARAPDEHRIDEPTADQRIFTKIAHTLAKAGMPAVTATSLAASVGLVESHELDPDTKVYFSKKRRITEGFRQLSEQKRRESMSIRRQFMETKSEIAARERRRLRHKTESAFFAAENYGTVAAPIIREQAAFKPTKKGAKK